MALRPTALHEQLFQTTVPTLRWNSTEDVAAWQSRVRDALRQLLGWPLMRTEADLRIEWEKNFDENTREIRLLFASEPGVQM